MPLDRTLMYRAAMPSNTHRHLIVASLAAVALLGCDDEKPGDAAPTTTATAKATAAATAKGETAEAKAEAAPKRAATEAAVTKHGGDEEVSYSIVLPGEGLKDVSEMDSMREYRKGKEALDGYNVTIGVADERRVKAGADAFATAAEAKGKKVLDKGEYDNGWYLLIEHSDADDPKPLLLNAIITEGDVSLSCRVDAGKEVVTDAEAAKKALIETCRSLKIKG